MRINTDPIDGGATGYTDSTVTPPGTYTCRSLPTFEEGFVTDGAYGFGFGAPAELVIPSGRRRVVINPRMKNSAFGSLALWANLNQGRRNTVRTAMLPAVNAQIPFRRILSGQSQAMLAGGALKLDLSGAVLTFPDLRDQGDVHVQFISSEVMPYPPLKSNFPQWGFCLQPMGVQVSGSVGVTLDIPARNGSHAYLDDFGELAVLVGLDPESLMIVPVGVGRVDQAARTVTSQGAVGLQRLDFIGYVLKGADIQPVLAQYADGQIGLPQLIAALDSTP